MNNSIPFDKDKFINECSCGCTTSRQELLNYIDQYKDSHLQISKYLEQYRDRLWLDQVRNDHYHQMRYDLGDEVIKQNTVSALRALADKIEQAGPHFIIFCKLPEVPIFSEGMFSHLEVSVLAGPVGG